MYIHMYMYNVPYIYETTCTSSSYIVMMFESTNMYMYAWALTSYIMYIVGAPAPSLASFWTI